MNQSEAQGFNKGTAMKKAKKHIKKVIPAKGTLPAEGTGCKPLNLD